jgi:4'-phosphopantetheinyl transferase
MRRLALTHSVSVAFSTALSTKLVHHVAGQIMTAMLPLLMMRHRRISRAKWRDYVTSTGKHWIERVSHWHYAVRYRWLIQVPSFLQSPDDMPPEIFLQSMTDYHLAYDNSLCGMVMTQGRQRQVINIGLGIKQIAVEPRGATVAAYAESHAHKVSLM